MTSRSSGEHPRVPGPEATVQRREPPREVFVGRLGDVNWLVEGQQQLQKRCPCRRTRRRSTGGWGGRGRYPCCSRHCASPEPLESVGAATVAIEVAPITFATAVLLALPMMALVAPGRVVIRVAIHAPTAALEWHLELAGVRRCKGRRRMPVIVLLVRFLSLRSLGVVAVRPFPVRVSVLSVLLPVLLLLELLVLHV